jgi:peptidoglycan L-alanyl-D-glutamate endopeptidase CwlK
MLPKANALLYSLTHLGIDHVITCTLRSLHEQAELYEQGRSKPGAIVTWARPGESAHNFGLGMDVYPLINGKLCTAFKEGDDVSDPIWQQFGKAVRDAGLAWGGDFKDKADAPHSQHPDWKRLSRE